MSRPTAISLFSGLGGIDIGLHQAGIETRVAVEKEATAASTLRANSSAHGYTPVGYQNLLRKEYPWTVIEADLYEIETEKILAAGDLVPGEVDLVVGGPPCQTFSRSNEGNREGTAAEQGMLYEEYARVLREVRPKGFFFENVRGLVSSNGGKDLEIIEDELASAGYKIAHDVLNAADYGVHQTRKRLCILGRRDGEKPQFPKPTHSEAGDTPTDMPEWKTAHAALRDFDLDRSIENKGGYENAVGGRYGYLLKDIPPGANYQHFSERRYDPESGEFVQRDEDNLEEKEFDWRSRHWNYLLKQDPDRPTWTLQADPGTYVGPFHWRSRPFGFLEQMRLMDIPVDYYVEGRPRDIQRQIGNSVPPGLASAIASSLLEQINGSPPKPKLEQAVEPDGGTRDESDERKSFDVDNGSSPWEVAEMAIGSLETYDQIKLSAKGSKIANAIDVAELVRRATEAPLESTVEEFTETNPDGKSDVLSIATVTLKRT